MTDDNVLSQRKRDTAMTRPTDTSPQKPESGRPLHRRHARASAAPGNAQTLFDQAEDSARPPGTAPALDVSGALAALAQRLDGLASEIRRFDGNLSAVSAEIGELKTEKRVLTEMHDRCRKLTEQFHERECLYPVFRSVIAAADRCRRETTRLQRLLSGHPQDMHLDAALALRHLLEARKADLLELEALLANFGVEAFHHPGDAFDPSEQKCIKPVHIEDARLDRRIAKRLLPGYRRDSKIIRPEYVTVYILSSTVHNEREV